MLYQKECELFAENRKVLKKVFRMDGSVMHTCCAVMLAAAGKNADEDLIRQCRHLLREETGALSRFRGMAEAPAVSRIALSGNPERFLENSLAVYTMLKEEFSAGTYLPVAAMILAGAAAPSGYEQTVRRTRKIYDQMKQKHRMLTGAEDSAFCAVMALSERSDEALITDMEECYRILKPRFFHANHVQALSSVLALYGEEPAEKCRRVQEIFAAFRKAGRRYGTTQELPLLGLLAMIYEDPQEAVSETLAVESQLKDGLMTLSISRKHRLMYAGILACGGRLAHRQTFGEGETDTAGSLPEKTVLDAAEIIMTLSIIIAQEIAMVSVITAANASH